MFSLDPQISYAEINWSNNGGNGQLSNNIQSLIVGGVAHWDPVPLLDFSFELMYQNTHMATPSNWIGPGGKNIGTINGIVSPFANNTDGVAGRIYITRNF